jgi:hypothetical protein
MQAVEFQTKIVDGTIAIPETLRDRFTGDVSVILFSAGAGADRQIGRLRISGAGG